MLEKLKNLTKQQKIVYGAIAAVAVALIVTVALLIAPLLGGQNLPAGGTEESGVKTYTIDLKTNGGKTFEKIEIHVFEDSSMSDLVAVGKTDANGVFTFDAEYSKDYVAVLKNMPAGYHVENYYTLTETTLSLTFEAKLLAVGDVTSALKLGGVAADMTVKTADGTTYSISELLKTKEAVVLNFWYEGCQPCKAEFPYMEEAYKEYSDKIEILAINPYDGDDASVAAYKAAMGLTFPMAKADAAYTTAYGVLAFPTTVVIDRYGTIGFMHTGSVPNADSFKNLFGYFTGDDYVQSTVRNLDDIVPEVEGGNGTKEYPYEEYRTEFDIEVESGKEVYYQMFKVNGMLLEIQDADAYVIFGDKKYEAVDGKVSLILTTEDTYTPAIFAVGNKSAAKKTFKANISFLPGTSGNPFVMNLGAFTAKIEAGNEQGIYYTYTATENGTFSLQCTGVTTGAKYDFSLYNTTTYALRNLSSDAEGDGVVSIAVNAGDVVQISVGVLPNEDNEIPTTDFNFKASFEKGEGTGVDPNATVDFTVTITDQKGNGVAGVVVKFTDEITATTNADGVATMNLPNGNYVVKLVAPKGYKEDNTEYIMTKAGNTLNVTLEKTKIVNKTYTVKVVDESGKAIANAGVTVDGKYLKTDANGMVSYTLEEGTYTASVAADGYESASKKFGSATDITVTLKKETVAVKTVEYTVSVYRILNNKQSNLKNVKVQFKSGDTVVAEVTTNDSGKAVAKLKEGNYTAIVSDATYGSGVVELTAKKNSVSLFAAKSLDMSDTTEVCEKKTVTVKTGATGQHLVIMENGDTYFMFSTSKAGKYTITVSGVGAKVAYVGGVNFLSSPIYESNERVVNIDSSQAANEIAYVFSVTGTSDTVVTVVRTGDAEEVAEIPNYTGTCGTPSKFTLSGDGNKLTYFDAASTANVTIVKGDDGYYHYGSKTGPIVYINLNNASYISISAVVNSQSFKNAELNEGYNDLMIKYTGSKDTMGNVISASCLDSTYGVYPLNDDLMHMVKFGGKQMGWWTKGENNYLFGTQTVDAETVWLALCCYIPQ